MVLRAKCGGVRMRLWMIRIFCFYSVIFTSQVFSDDFVLFSSGSYCLGKTYFDDFSCVLTTNITSSTSVFEYDGYWYLLDSSPDFKCPSDMQDHGVFDNGRHCFTGISVLNQEVYKLNNKIYTSITKSPPPIGTICPSISYYDGLDCLLTKQVTSSTSVFEFDGYWHLLDSDPEFKCPLNMQDDGVFDNGRHCFTSIDSRDHYVYKLNGSIYATLGVSNNR